MSIDYNYKYLKYKIKYHAMRDTLNNFEKFNLNFSNKNKYQIGSGTSNEMIPYLEYIKTIYPSPHDILTDLPKIILTGLMDFYNKIKKNPIEIDYDIIKNKIEKEIDYNKFLSGIPKETLVDDNIYKLFKFTILKKDTILYTRIKKPINNIMTFDYMGREENMVRNNHSFLETPLKKPLDNSYLLDLQNLYYKKTVELLGNTMYKFKIVNDLFILHFPIDYSNLHSINAITAFFKKYINTIPCFKYCNGYTIDCFTFNEDYGDLKNMYNYREICIYDPANIELLGSAKVKFDDYNFITNNIKDPMFTQEREDLDISIPSGINLDSIKHYFNKVDDLNNFIDNHIHEYEYIYISFGSAYQIISGHSSVDMIHYQAIPCFFNKNDRLQLFKNGETKILNIICDNTPLCTDYNQDNLNNINIRLRDTYKQDIIYCRFNMLNLLNYSFLRNIKQKINKKEFNYNNKLLVCNFLRFYYDQELSHPKEFTLFNQSNKTILGILQEDDDMSDSYYIGAGFSKSDDMIRILQKYIIKYNNYFKLMKDPIKKSYKIKQDIWYKLYREKYQFINITDMDDIEIYSSLKYFTFGL